MLNIGYTYMEKLRDTCKKLTSIDTGASLSVCLGRLTLASPQSCMGPWPTMAVSEILVSSQHEDSDELRLLTDRTCVPAVVVVLDSWLMAASQARLFRSSGRVVDVGEIGVSSALGTRVRAPAGRTATNIHTFCELLFIDLYFPHKPATLH
nr:unnamed protein product [Callosobruchus analis]